MIDKPSLVRVLPRSTDENALAYLQRHQCDPDRAMFAFLAAAGGGREVNSRKWRRIEGTKRRIKGEGWRGEAAGPDKVFRPSEDGADKKGWSASHPNAHNFDHGAWPSRDPGVAPPGAPRAVVPNPNLDGAKLGGATEVSSSNVQGSDVRRPRGSDRSEVKNRWNSLHEDLEAMLEDVEDGNMPRFEDCSRLIKDAIDMPKKEVRRAGEGAERRGRGRVSERSGVRSEATKTTTGTRSEATIRSEYCFFLCSSSLRRA